MAMKQWSRLHLAELAVAGQQSEHLDGQADAAFVRRPHNWIYRSFPPESRTWMAAVSRLASSTRRGKVVANAAASTVDHDQRSGLAPHVALGLLDDTLKGAGLGPRCRSWRLRVPRSRCWSLNPVELTQSLILSRRTR